MKKIKALNEKELGQVAGGGIRTTVTYDEYGELIQTESVCDRCGRVTDKIRYSRNPNYSELCDECFRSMQDYL